MSSDSEQEKNKKLTHTRNLGHKEFLQYIKSQPNLSQIIFNIEKYLANYQFYFNTVLAINKGKDLQQLQISLKKEYNELIEGKSFLHKINKSIVSRSKCLDKIKTRLTKAQQILRSFKKVYYKDSIKDNVYAQYVDIQGFSPLELDQTIDKSIETIKNIFIDMARLRDMTIYIVQQIHQWRIKIQQYSDRCGQHLPIYFMYAQKNFYESIQTDLTCIWQSQLSSYILFKDKHDPLLIRNVVYLQQKQTKQVLEKYFVEMLYPQNEEIIDKAIRCLQMIIYKYTPKTVNLFEEEQQLIENYLNLQRKRNPLSPQKQQQNQILKWQNAKPSDKAKPQGANDRGWVFGKKLQKRQRIKQIVQRHQEQMMLGPYRPFALTSILEKKGLPTPPNNDKASKVLQSYKVKTFSIPKKRGKSTSLKKLSDRPISENEMYSSVKQKSSQNIVKQEKYQSDPEQNKNRASSQMFRSLTKLNTIIYQDPNQSSHQTPKMKPNQGQMNTNPNFFSSPRLHSQNFMKINTFLEQQQLDKSKIDIQQEQQPLNVKQFLDLFRAETSKPRKPATINKKLEQQKNARMRVYSIKELIAKRKQQAKSVPYLKKYRIPKANLPNQRLKKLKYSVANKKSLDKSRKNDSNQQKSFNSYTKINTQDLKTETIQNIFQAQKETFISLKPKSIPYDIIGMYLRHILSLQPATSKSFTSFDPIQIEKKLEDPFTHCFIFDLWDEKAGHIGQVIVSQSLGNRRGMLRYTIQFINVKIFQYLINAIARVAQQLLSSTPCEEFLCPFVVDKMDAVSTHFIELIDHGLKERSKKFSMFHILQKKKFSYKDTDFYERIYVFNSLKTKATEAALGIKMMGNYRSISFIGKGLLLSSNFKLRSKNLAKQIINNYNTHSIGSLYIRILEIVMNKYHLKQLKTASMSLNDGDQMVSLVKHNPFIRNLIYGLIAFLRNRQKIIQDQTIAVVKFNTMAQLLSYLRYRQFDQSFEFNFLQQSKFILNHELTLAEFSYEVSLQFMVASSPQFLILGNHRNQQINQIKSRQFETLCYLLPTTQKHQKILLMDGKQYEQGTTDKLDLFSYLSLFFKNQHSNILLNDIPQIVIPNMRKKHQQNEKVKGYQGLFRLFPQRQFYSGVQLEIVNHWQGYYPSAIVRMPDQKAIILQYPLIVGFYNCKTNEPQIGFLIKDRKRAENIFN